MARSYTGKTPLWKAQRNSEVLGFLISHGADVDDRDELDQRTPLFQAILDKTPTQALLEHGADIGVVIEGSTPLQIAHATGNQDALYWMVRLRPNLWEMLRKLLT